MTISIETIKNLETELNSIDSFLGGPADLFNQAGDVTLRLLKDHNITPTNSIVDIGCGCLRIGAKLITYLNPNLYFGIEPNKKMLDLGIKHLIEPQQIKLKSPSFSNSSTFDLQSFNKPYFDAFIARSIWTHASKQQIEQMLNMFKQFSSKNSLFLPRLKPTTREHTVITKEVNGLVEVIKVMFQVSCTMILIG